MLPRRGGAQDYIHFIAREWIKHGVQVDILCGQENHKNGYLPEKENIDGLKIMRVGTPSSRFFNIRKTIKKIHHDYDVVIENIMGYPLFIPTLPRANNTLYAIKHHYEGHNFINSQGLVKGAIGIILEEVIQPLIYRNVSLVGVSDKTVAKLKSAWIKPRKNIATIPPGIDIDYDQICINRNKLPHILYFGALDIGRKRVDHLIDAFREISNIHADALLTIGGAGPDESVLKQKSAGLNVQFEGFLSEQRKKQLLETAWIFCSPSNSEGFGITWIEANAYQLPVIGYDLNLDTLNDQCSIMVSENDIQALANEIDGLISNQLKRDEMGKQGLKNSKRYNWENSSQYFYRLLVDN